MENSININTFFAQNMTPESAPVVNVYNKMPVMPNDSSPFRSPDKQSQIYIFFSKRFYNTFHPHFSLNHLIIQATFHICFNQNSSSLLPLFLDRYILLRVLQHDLGNSKFKVLLCDMHSAFPQGIHACLSAHTLDFSS